MVFWGLKRGEVYERLENGVQKREDRRLKRGGWGGGGRRTGGPVVRGDEFPK